MKKNFIIGLTGSIATGKSAMAEMLIKKGFPILDSDGVARAISTKGGAGYEEIMAGFPDAVSAGELDRKKLAKIVFADREKLLLLEKILHPKIAKVRQDFYQEQEGIVFIMVPLLFEKGIDQECDKTLVITTTPDRQKSRVMEREGMTEDLFVLIQKQQMTEEEKIARADYVIENNGSLVDLENHLTGVLAEIEKIALPIMAKQTR